MARILIGNIKGPKGDTGAKGATGPQGPAGPQGPLPPLTNNALATQAGVSALDAVMGKTLDEKIGKVNSDLTSVTAQLTGTPVLLGPGSILENIKWYIKNHLHVRGSFPYEPDHNNNNRVSDLPAGAEAWGRVEWFKLASDEYRVILYTENNVKTYHRLIVSGSWSGDWEEK